MRSAFPVLLLGAALQAMPSPAAAQDALLLMRGTDTISVERIQYQARGVAVELLFKAASVRFNYTLAWGADGRVARMENAVRAATADANSPAQQTAVIDFIGDSAIVTINPGPAQQIQRLAARAGAVPFLNPSFLVVERAIQQARATHATSVPMFAVSGGKVFDMSVTAQGTDSVIVNIGGLPAHLAVDANWRIIGGGVPAQGLQLVRTSALGAGAMSVEKPDYSAPAGAPYTAEDVTVTTPMGHTLAGTLTLPVGAKGKVPAIVTITGSGLEDRDENLGVVLKGYRPFREVADALGRAGIAVLRMDDRGFGASKGNGATATSEDFANDIRAGLAFLRARPDIDGARLGLVGHSEGGLIGPMVATTDLALRGLVIMAGPAYTGRKIIAYQNANGIDHAPDSLRAKRDSLLAVAAKSVDSLASVNPWMKFFLDYDPIPTAKRVKTPTLILQGDTDQQVTPEQADLLAAAIRSGGNTRVAVRHFPASNHLFVADPDGNPAGYSALPHTMRPEVLQAIVAFLQDRLR